MYVHLMNWLLDWKWELLINYPLPADWELGSDEFIAEDGGDMEDYVYHKPTRPAPPPPIYSLGSMAYDDTSDGEWLAAGLHNLCWTFTWCWFMICVPRNAATECICDEMLSLHALPFYFLSRFNLHRELWWCILSFVNILVIIYNF